MSRYRDKYIEYKGRYFTPLELTEFLGEGFGSKVVGDIKRLTNLIKLAEKGIKEDQEVIDSLKRRLEALPPESAEAYSSRNLTMFQEASIARARKAISSYEAYVQFDLSVIPGVKILEDRLKKDVKDLK